MIGGVILGLGAAFCQSGSYLFSKRYVAKFEKSTIGLLVAGHCIMGLFSLALLPLVMPERMPALSGFAIPLFVGVACYLIGQASFFLALKTEDASRLSPLLGLKIIMLAGLTGAVLSQHFSPLQWGGIALSIIAAALLGLLGTRMTARGWLWVLFACFFYSVSDLCIKQLITHFAYLGLISASALSTCLCYLLSAIAAAACLPLFRAHSASRWKAALPFAVFWYAGILLLFGCFGSIGVVFGNIVQSTRGVISIIGGSIVAFRGYEHIEERAPAPVVLWRVAAGVLMVAAITAFYAGN